jgi:hypothetical protein
MQNLDIKTSILLEHDFSQKCIVYDVALRFQIIYFTI